MCQLIAPALQNGLLGAALTVLAITLLFIAIRSFWTIGPTEVGLVRTRFGASASTAFRSTTATCASRARKA